MKMGRRTRVRTARRTGSATPTLVERVETLDSSPVPLCCVLCWDWPIALGGAPPPLRAEI